MDKRERMFAMVASSRPVARARRGSFADHGLPLATFQYWLAKKREEAEADATLPMRFVRLSVDKDETQALEIVFPNGVRVRGFSLDTDLVARVAYAWR